MFRTKRLVELTLCRLLDTFIHKGEQEGEFIMVYDIKPDFKTCFSELRLGNGKDIL